MGEAFQRNGVAIVDQLLHGVTQRKYFSHEVLPYSNLIDWTAQDSALGCNRDYAGAPKQTIR
jgi:hypothetical protein